MNPRDMEYKVTIISRLLKFREISRISQPGIKKPERRTALCS
jgi:hypothetical protein